MEKGGKGGKGKGGRVKTAKVARVRVQERRGIQGESYTCGMFGHSAANCEFLNGTCNTCGERVTGAGQACQVWYRITISL